MAFFGGTTVLKYKKSEDVYKNSTGTCTVDNKRAFSYREKIAIAGEYVIDGAIHNLIFLNTHYWSQNTNSHRGAIEGHKHLGTGRWIKLNFHGTMNFLDSSGTKTLTLEDLANCKVNENLINFVTEFYPKQAEKFIEVQIAAEKAVMDEEKKSKSARDMRTKISRLEYANPKTFERALIKYKSLENRVGLYLTSDTMKKNYLEISPFLDMIAKHLDLFKDENNIFEFITNHKMKIFTEIGG